MAYKTYEKVFLHGHSLRSRNENVVCILESLLPEAILVHYAVAWCLDRTSIVFGITACNSWVLQCFVNLTHASDFLSLSLSSKVGILPVATIHVCKGLRK